MLIYLRSIQIGIFNAPEAQRLEAPITAIIAGSAPTAHLIAELEKINIGVTHVYGLTCVNGSSQASRTSPSDEILSAAK